MQLLINISKEIYERALQYKDSPIVSNLANDYPELTRAVANGTPLPKHSRLINDDRYEIEDAPSIVEADIENKKEKEQKYCDRNICMLNEYRGIECDKCEVMAERDDYIYTGY